MEEKRKHVRVEAPVVTTYKVLDPLKAGRKTVLRNFSGGGIRFPVYEKLKVGTLVELYIESPFDTLPIFVQGEVVWVRSLNIQEGREIYDTGVRFTALKKLDKKRLDQATKDFLAMGKKYRAE